MPRQKAIFGVLSETVRVDPPDSHFGEVTKCLRSGWQTDTLKVSTSFFRKRLCLVDVRIPGPNIFRGKGVNIHAVDLGALRTLEYASD
jgi:hypothetical protein